MRMIVVGGGIGGLTAAIALDRVGVGIRTDGQFVYSLPRDIIDNTRRANNFSPATADGYSTLVGSPTGRTLRPATARAVSRS